MSPALGRDVIAITSVGVLTMEWSKTMPGDPHVPWRTAAIAMAALPTASLLELLGALLHALFDCIQNLVGDVFGDIGVGREHRILGGLA